MKSIAKMAADQSMTQAATQVAIKDAKAVIMFTREAESLISNK